MLNIFVLEFCLSWSSGVLFGVGLVVFQSGSGSGSVIEVVSCPICLTLFSGVSGLIFDLFLALFSFFFFLCLFIFLLDWIGIKRGVSGSYVFDCFLTFLFFFVVSFFSRRFWSCMRLRAVHAAT